MATTDELNDFVRDSLNRGSSRDEIREVLLDAGWSEAQVVSAIAGFAETDFGIAVPRPRPSLSAREAFEYLVLFGTLYLGAFSLGQLLFQFINLGLPDPLWPRAQFIGMREIIRWSISTLVVATPVFLCTARIKSRELQASPVKRASPVRRWLTYLTLAVAGSVLIGDGTSLVYNLLGGDTTTRFLLKTAVVGLIAGTAFLYFLSDLRSDEKGQATPPGSLGKRILGVATSMVVIAVIAGIVVIGSPAEGRFQALDTGRIADLQGIMEASDDYWARNERLPASLEELARDARTDVNTIDPGTALPYDYRVLGEDTYQLCASFDRPSQNPPSRSAADFWRHGAGQQCFELEVDKSER